MHFSGARFPALIAFVLIYQLIEALKKFLDGLIRFCGIGIIPVTDGKSVGPILFLVVAFKRPQYAA
jgi:hypothetical protein